MSTKELYTEWISLKPNNKKKNQKGSYQDHSSWMAKPRRLFIHAIAEEDEVYWHNEELTGGPTTARLSSWEKELNKLMTFHFFNESCYEFERWTDANKFKHLIKCCDDDCKKAETQDYCATLWSIFAMSHQNKPFTI